jgi:hypothetical protein
MVKNASNPEQAKQKAEEERADRMVREIFEEHYASARKRMPPDAALHTAYAAAQNYLTSLKQAKGSLGVGR